MNRQFRQKSYTYLANPETLDVIRLSNDKETKQLVSQINGYLETGYFRTRKEIYRRFKDGLLSEQSFTKVERPKGSGNFVTANIFINQ